MQTKATNPRTMSFTQTGMTLVVGEEWECQNVDSERSLYPPTLVSQAGRIRVLLLPPDRSNPAVVANGLRTAFEANPLVAKHSFRKGQFARDKGAQQPCVSYLQRVNLKAAVRVSSTGTHDSLREPFPWINRCFERQQA